MLGSITRACALHGYDLLVSFQQLSDDWHADYEDSMKADGLILLGYGDYLAYESKLAAPGRAGHAFRALGRGAAGAAGDLDRLRQLPGRALTWPPTCWTGAARIAFLGDASTHYPEFFERVTRLRWRLREAGLRMNPALQVDADHHRAIRLRGGQYADRSWHAVRCGVRRQRPDRDRRDEGLARARPAGARRRGGGRLRRHRRWRASPIRR
jgi:hypothetical protein